MNCFYLLTYLHMTLLDTVPCEPGTYAKRRRMNPVLRVSFCDDCPAGTVQGHYSRPNCDRCPSGTVPNEEKTLCISKYTIIVSLPVPEYEFFGGPRLDRVMGPYPGSPPTLFVATFKTNLTQYKTSILESRMSTRVIAARISTVVTLNSW